MLWNKQDLSWNLFYPKIKWCFGLIVKAITIEWTTTNFQPNPFRANSNPPIWHPYYTLPEFYPIQEQDKSMEVSTLSLAIQRFKILCSMFLGRGRGCQIGGFGWLWDRYGPSRGPNNALRVSIGSLTTLPSKSFLYFFFLRKKKTSYTYSQTSYTYFQHAISRVSNL